MAFQPSSFSDPSKRHPFASQNSTVADSGLFPANRNMPFGPVGTSSLRNATLSANSSLPASSINMTGSARPLSNNVQPNTSGSPNINPPKPGAAMAQHFISTPGTKNPSIAATLSKTASPAPRKEAVPTGSWESPVMKLVRSNLVNTELATRNAMVNVLLGLLVHLVYNSLRGRIQAAESAEPQRAAHLQQFAYQYGTDEQQATGAALMSVLGYVLRGLQLLFCFNVVVNVYNLFRANSKFVDVKMSAAQRRLFDLPASAAGDAKGEQPPKYQKGVATSRGSVFMTEKKPFSSLLKPEAAMKDTASSSALVLRQSNDLMENARLRSVDSPLARLYKKLNAPVVKDVATSELGKVALSVSNTSNVPNASNAPTIASNNSTQALPTQAYSTNSTVLGPFSANTKPNVY